MPQPVKQYHLHKNDFSKLHFEVNDAHAYTQKHAEHCYRPHRHSFYQLIWFTTPGQHFVDYETIPHAANTLFFINSGQVHYFCQEAENRGRLFHFNDYFLHQHDKDADKWLRYKLYNEVGPPYVVPDAETMATIGQLATMIEHELAGQQHNHPSQVYYLFQALLLKVERLKHQAEPKTDGTDQHFELAVQFKQAIDQSLDQNLTINEYGQQLHVSPKVLTEVSKKYLHDTPANIVHQRKVLEAKRLLSNTSLTIKEVAYSLGFDQPTYFTKYFKKHTELTPRQFVAQLP